MFCFLFIIFALIYSITPTEYGNNCKLLNQQEGLCVPVRSCKTTYNFFNNILKNGGNISESEREMLRNLQCGIMKNGNILVCCDITEIQLNPVALGLLKKNNCGIYSINRVSHGKDAILFGFPWMALLKYDDPIMPFKCGGSLISDPVRLGEHRLSTDKDCMNLGKKTICAPPVEDVGIEEVIKHSYYNETLYNDIALIRLKRVVVIQQHIKPICLPIYDDLRAKDYSEFVISGWGATQNGSYSDVLQVAVVPSVNRDDCQSHLKKLFFTQDLTLGRLCAGGENFVDTCKGDSGGPLGYKDMYNAKPSFIQFGIVSAGYRYCGLLNAPALYTNVSHYMQWITDHMY
ncbi:serine protease grass-like isoform 2-T2 [Cochliomyia hominivorax]